MKAARPSARAGTKRAGTKRGAARQVRGEAKRRAVLEATLRLLAREGPRGVTHRAVATEAGTSLRATTYYFTSREELLTEALRHYAATAIARFDAIRAPLAADVATPVAAAADLLAATVLSDVVDDRAGLVAEYELVLEVGRNAALEPVYRAWQAKLETLLAGYAALLGSGDPALDARLVLATLRGLELEALARPSERPSRRDLRALFARLLGGLRATGRAAQTAAAVSRTSVTSGGEPRRRGGPQ
ncbi:MAG: TetR family transcriptional regulator [Myxococcales bacterium]|nr:TetR family transcriptional regulator [Myxococcales bacterium]